MREYNLSYPDAFLTATPQQLAQHCHGCGPGSGLGAWIVPDSLWGCCITPACQMHDFEYAMGKTWADRKTADKRFLDNMTALILNQGGWLKSLRLWSARRYYQAVRDLGGVFYAKGKKGLA